ARILDSPIPSPAGNDVEAAVVSRALRTTARRGRKARLRDAADERNERQGGEGYDHCSFSVVHEWLLFVCRQFERGQEPISFAATITPTNRSSFTTTKIRGRIANRDLFGDLVSRRARPRSHRDLRHANLNLL